MKKSLFLLINSFSVLLIISSYSFACSVEYFPDDRFDKKSFIFLGEVIGYSDKIQSKKVRNEAYGVRVKVLEKFYLYKETNDYFEVVPLNNDCLPTGYELEYLKEDYPIGSKVKVIAGEGKLIPNKNKTGQTVLQLRHLDSILFLTPNELSVSPLASSFDYSKWKGFYIQETNFELQKDFYRLETAKTEEEKVKILERIIYFDEYISDLAGYRINYQAIAKNYLRTSSKLKDLMQKRKELELKRSKR